MSTLQLSPEPHHVHWLALALTPSLGPSRCRRLVEHFGGTSAVFAASLTELEAAGLPTPAAQAIALGKSQEMAQEELVRAAAVGAHITTLDDPAYPVRLKQIYDPPVALYIRGDAAILAHPGLAVVGTRHPTPYGIGMAERLSCDLATRGIIIISGMARGVDTAAHRGALAAKARTAAIFGTGIDVLYPRENSRLAEQILALGGALVSEFPVGTFAAAAEFSHSQPHHQRTERGRVGGGSGRVQRHAYHRALRPGAEPRVVCRSGQRH